MTAYTANVDVDGFNFVRGFFTTSVMLHLWEVANKFLFLTKPDPTKMLEGIREVLFDEVTRTFPVFNVVPAFSLGTKLGATVDSWKYDQSVAVCVDADGKLESCFQGGIYRTVNFIHHPTDAHV